MSCEFEPTKVTLVVCPLGIKIARPPSNMHRPAALDQAVSIEDRAYGADGRPLYLRRSRSRLFWTLCYDFFDSCPSVVLVRCDPVLATTTWSVTRKPAGNRGGLNPLSSFQRVIRRCAHIPFHGRSPARDQVPPLLSRYNKGVAIDRFPAQLELRVRRQFTHKYRTPEILLCCRMYLVAPPATNHFRRELQAMHDLCIATNFRTPCEG